MALEVFPLSEVQMSGQAEVVGDVGVMAPMKCDLDLSGQAQITGTLYIESGIKVDVDGGAHIGATKNTDLSSLENMILSLVTADTHLAVTQTFEDIKKGMVIQGNGKTNVVSINGDIDLSGKDSLVLMGGMSDKFILDVAGEVSLSGSSSILVSGGALASNVYIHILGPDEKHLSRCSNAPHGGDLELTGGSSLDGNVYVFNGKTEISGSAAVHGSVAAAGQIQLTGQAQIVGDPACKAPVTTPPDTGCKCGDDDDYPSDGDHGRDKAQCDRDPPPCQCHPQDGGDHGGGGY